MALPPAASAPGAPDALGELRKLAHEASWQLASGGLLAAAATLLILCFHFGVAALHAIRDRLFVTFTIGRRSKERRWLEQWLASQANSASTPYKLYDPKAGFMADMNDGSEWDSYDSMGDGEEEEEDEGDAPALCVGGAEGGAGGAGLADGVLLQAAGGTTKRLRSRMVPGGTQLVTVNGSTVWVRRRPKEALRGRDRHSVADPMEGALSFTMLARGNKGAEIMGQILVAARERDAAQEKGTLELHEAVDGAAADDDGDSDDGGCGGYRRGRGARKGGNTQAMKWAAAPSPRALALSQVELPETHVGAPALLRDVARFLESERWYAQRGIPYRRGYLIHGPPGSGKTMLAAAVASELRLKVYAVDLAHGALSDEALATLFDDVPSRSIILLERVDRAFDGRQRTFGAAAASSAASTTTVSSDGAGGGGALTFSGLLNVLDGVLATEGCVTIFTAEKGPAALDHALMRPGRCDYTIELPAAQPDTAARLFFRFFERHPLHQLDAPALREAAAAFRAALASRPPAAAPYSMRDVVSFLSIRSPQEAAREADAIGIDAGEAAARAAAGGAEGLTSVSAAAAAAAARRR